MSNKLFLITCLTVAGALQAGSTRSLCVGLELNPVASQVEQAQKGNFLWRWWQGKAARPTTTGVKIAIAFLNKGIDGFEFNYKNNQDYTIPQALDVLDLAICQRISRQNRSKGGVSGSCTDESFTHVTAVKKQFFDVVPAILEQSYGVAAAPYIAAITKARAEFEATHAGSLLERS